MPIMKSCTGACLALLMGIPALALDCTKAAIASTFPSGLSATVNYAQRVPKGGSFGGAPYDPFSPVNATGLPALCAVSINIPSTSRTSYNFGLFLPDDYNGRLITTGNGGFGGGINWLDMAALVHYGMASMSTDTGHISPALSGLWGLNQPEQLYDWGYRAMHGSVSLAKEVVKGWYGRNISYSYYAGCSTGGRQGLKEIQDHPDSFDGLAVGAPAWDLPNLAASTLKFGLLNLPVNSSHHIPTNLFPVIVAEVTRQCDPQDGLGDGIVSDPMGCNVRFEELLCKPGQNASSCLTPSQLTTVYRTFNDFVDVNQTFVFSGLTLGTDPTFLLATPVQLGIDYFQDWVHNDTKWDYTQFTYADIELAARIQPGNAAANNYDLSPFKARGGKIIQYHGSADNLIPTGTSLYFYNHVYAKMLERGTISSNLDDFFRLFLIPGMQHCSASANAPWYIGAAGQAVTGADHSVPGYADPDHDVVLAMMRWVEQGRAPDRLVATKYKNDTVAYGVQLQRPLCPYPRQAKFAGSGNASDPASWDCKSLY